MRRYRLARQPAGDIGKMRRRKPHLCVVLRAYTEALQLRDEKTQYTHGLYRGFYAELSRKLGVTENAIKQRLDSAIVWFGGECQKWIR